MASLPNKGSIIFQKNVIDKTMSEKLWIPSLIFPQSEGNIILNVDESSFMFVVKNGSGNVSGSEYTDESLVYKGQENWILFFKKLQLKHQCHFNFAHYPFDTQKCHIKVWKCKIYIFTSRAGLVVPKLYFFLGGDV